jgi:tetratricopeptide (TPR) repeat protein
MSRINNALNQQETASQKLRLIETIDGNQLDSRDYLVENKKQRKTVIIACVAILAVAAIAHTAYKSYRLKKETLEAATKGISYLEQMDLSTQAFSKQDYDGALRGYQKLLNDGRKANPLLLVDIGMTYKKKGDLKNAKQSYQAALNADPKYSAAYNNLAMISVEENDWAGAISLLEKAISLDPEHLAPVLNLAKLYERSSKWGLATASYTKYLLSPKADPAIKNLVQKRLKKLHSLTETDANQWEKP